MPESSYVVNIPDRMDRSPVIKLKRHAAGGYLACLTSEEENNLFINQRGIGFGEKNKPVLSWGDYMDGIVTYGVTRKPGSCHCFIIKYETRP